MKWNHAERRSKETRLKQACHKAARIANGIKENDSNVRAVILFSSVARDDPVNSNFDIDLALEGGATLA